MNRSTPLLLIDIQKGLDQWQYYGDERNNLNAELICGSLLELWRRNSWPVIHVKHNSIHPYSPLNPNNTGNEIKKIVAPLPEERVFEKNVNSAFIGTHLDTYLQDNGWQQLVVVGLTTNHCISTSVRMASNMGYQILVVEDATAAFSAKGPSGVFYTAQTMHDTALASLQNEFAQVITSHYLLNH